MITAGRLRKKRRPTIKLVVLGIMISFPGIFVDGQEPIKQHETPPASSLMRIDALSVAVAQSDTNLDGRPALLVISLTPGGGYAWVALRP
jgi:hypothetical protein